MRLTDARDEPRDPAPRDPTPPAPSFRLILLEPRDGSNGRSRERYL